MKWWGWWRRGNGNAARAARAEANLHRVRRMTPRIEELAEAISLPDDEFADRVARAFRRRAP